MQRIYLPNTTFWKELIISDTILYHQITRVMRARMGQKYIFFDGKNLVDYIYQIENITKDIVILWKQEAVSKNSEWERELHVYQAFPNKLSKFETIIQKSCEVWYANIYFFPGENSQKIVLSDNKKERLQKIAIEAIEQCWWNRIPEINFLSSLSFEESEWACLQNGINFMCHTDWQNAKWLQDIKNSFSFKEENEATKIIRIVIGPEWGFSNTEIQELTWKWFTSVYLWLRILRLETVAPLVGFYLLQKD